MLVKMVEQGFELSEATHTPVMLEVRIRTCHVHGQFVAKDNKRPAFTLRQAMENPSRDVIKSRKLNEVFGPQDGPVGIIMLGGLYNTVLRGLQQLGLADVYGESTVPLYVLNVAYPIIEDEVVAFCAGKSAVLM